jgi:hypothetical protein
LHAMHQPDGAQKNIQRVGFVVVERLDGTVAGIFTAEHAHDIIEYGSDQGRVISGVDSADYARCLGPNRARIAVRKQIVDLGGCRIVLHVQISCASYPVKLIAVDSRNILQDSASIRTKNYHSVTPAENKNGERVPLRI